MSSSPASSYASSSSSASSASTVSQFGVMSDDFGAPLTRQMCREEAEMKRGRSRIVKMFSSSKDNVSKLFKSARAPSPEFKADELADYEDDEDDGYYNPASRCGSAVHWGGAEDDDEDDDSGRAGRFGMFAGFGGAEDDEDEGAAASWEATSYSASSKFAEADAFIGAAIASAATEEAKVEDEEAEFGPMLGGGIRAVPATKGSLVKNDLPVLPTFALPTNASTTLRSPEAEREEGAKTLRARREKLWGFDAAPLLQAECTKFEQEVMYFTGKARVGGEAEHAKGMLEDEWWLAPTGAGMRSRKVMAEWRGLPWWRFERDLLRGIEEEVEEEESGDESLNPSSLTMPLSLTVLEPWTRAPVPCKPVLELTYGEMAAACPRAVARRVREEEALRRLHRDVGAHAAFVAREWVRVRR